MKFLHHITLVLLGILILLVTQANAETCNNCKGSGTSIYKCPSCKGTGAKGDYKCSTCNGKGFNKCSSCNGTGQTQGSRSASNICNNCKRSGTTIYKCPACKGTGKKGSYKCPTCNGKKFDAC